MTFPPQTFCPPLLPLAVAAFFAAAVPLTAQEPTATPSPTPAATPPAEPATQEEVEGAELEETMAFIRTWFMASPDRPVRVQLESPASKEGPIVLVGQPSAFYYGTGYRDVPSSAGTVSVVTRTNNPQRLGGRPVRLRAEHFYTLLVQRSGGGFNIELIDDTLQPRPPEEPGKPKVPKSKLPPPVPRLSVYHFFEGSPVTVSSPENGFSANLQFGGSATLENPNHKDFILSILRKDAEGKEIRSDAEITLSTHPSASLLIIADPYGRFSPRVVLNGTLD